MGMARVIALREAQLIMDRASMEDEPTLSCMDMLSILPLTSSYTFQIFVILFYCFLLFAKDLCGSVNMEIGLMAGGASSTIYNNLIDKALYYFERASKLRIFYYCFISYF